MEKSPDTLPSEEEAEVQESGRAPCTVNPREGIATWKWIIICIALYMGALLYGLDTTVAADIQGQIYEDLGHIENLPWIGLGFPMASAAMILLLSRGYELFNGRYLYMLWFLVFEIGSAVCGAAPTSNALIVGRVIAGIGGAGMYLGGLTYISTYTTKAEGPLYNALIGLSWGIGSILGPIVGGSLSGSSATWRWAFYINLPCAAMLIPAYLLLFPSPKPRPDLTIKEKFANIDWLGAILNAATYVIFIVVVCFSGSVYAWGSGLSIALWVVFGVCLIAFILQQTFTILTTKENRIFPIHFFKSRSLILIFIATGSGMAAFSITLHYIPLFFQFTKGDSALGAAVRLLPFICIFIFFVMFAGATLPAIGRYNIYYLIGGSFILIGSSLLHTIDTTTPSAQIYGYEILVAVGNGLVWQIGYSVAVAKASPEDSWKALGFINLAQIGTASLSLAIAGSLFQNLGLQELKSAFAGYPYPDDYLRSALAGRISPVFSSNDEAAIQIAVVAAAETIRKVFALAMAGAALLIACTPLMRFEKLQLE